MRYYKIAAVLTLILLFCPLFASAQISTVYDSKDKTVEISGSFDKVKRIVTLMILPKDVDRATVTYQDINENKYVTKQAVLDAEGNFQIILTMPDSAPSNDYTVYAVCADEEYSSGFSHVSDNDLLSVLSLINAAGKDETAEIIKNNSTKIGLGSEYIDLYTGIGEIIYSQRPAKGYTLDDFPGELNRATAIESIRNGSNVDDVLKKFARDFDLNYETEFETLSKAVKDRFARAIKEEPITSSSKSFLYQCLILAGTDAASSYVEPGDVIVKFAARAEMDISAYNSLSQKTTVLQELYNSDVNSFSELVEKFNSLVKAAGSSGGSSSGSSGGSSGSGSSISFGSGSAANIQTTPVPSYAGFYDMENHWSRIYVENLAAKGIVSGFDDNSFKPDNSITRAEYVKLIIDALGISKTYNVYFEDVAEDAWYYPYVSAAKENGIVSGFDGKFNPGAEITREDAAVILYMAAEKKNIEFIPGSEFSDGSDISEYAKEAVLNLSGIGIITGSDSKFLPKNSTKRGEAAVMVYNLMNYTPALNTSEPMEINEEEYGLITSISDAEKFLPYEQTENVTRGDFICALISASGIQGLSSDPGFADVGAGSELYNYLSIAAANKIVPESENFRADDFITINEAAQFCVNMVGYGISAEKNGGYPTGYRSVASSIGILDGVHTSNTLSVAEAYKIIFNTLNTKYLEEAIVDGEMAFKSGDSTILSEYLNIRKITGVVTSNEYTEIGSISGSNQSILELEGTVGIDGVRYNAAGDFNDCIGYNVNAWIRYDKDSDEDEVVYLYKKNNREIKLLSGDLQYKDGAICQTEDSREKKYRLNRSVDIIVNHKADYTFDLSEIENINGSVLMISNDNSSEYNVLVIVDYKYMKVNSFDKANLVIRDIDKPENIITLTEDNIVSVLLDSENALTTLGEIETGSYIAAAVSKDNELCDIVILDTVAEGAVSSMSEDEMYIGDTMYKMSNYFMNNDIKRVTLGKEMSFCLGINDDIVALSYVDSEIIYGYLVWAKANEETQTVSMKIFTQYSEMLTLECEEKIKVDGVRREAYMAAGELQSPQLIRYSVSANNKVNLIDLAQVSTFYSDTEVDGLRDDNLLTRNKFSTSYYYRTKIFYPYFYIDNAIVFKVPQDTSLYDDYSIGYTFMDGNIADGTAVEAYNVGFDGQAQAVVAHVDTKSGENVALVNAQIIVVEKVMQKVDDKGDIRYAIIGWKDGQFVEYYMDEPVAQKYNEEAMIEPGDIIRVNLRDNDIQAVVVDFVGKDKQGNTGANVAPRNCRSTACHYQTGSVYSIKNGNAIISRTQTSGGAFDYSTQNLITVKIPTAVAIFNLDTNKLTVVDQNYINSYLSSGSKGSYIVVQQDYGVSQFCVIYEGGEE